MTRDENIRDDLRATRERQELLRSEVRHLNQKQKEVRDENRHLSAKVAKLQDGIAGALIAMEEGDTERARVLLEGWQSHGRRRRNRIWYPASNRMAMRDATCAPR